MLDHSITIPFPPDIAVRDGVRRAALRAARVEHPGLAAIDAHIVPGGVSLAYDVPDGTGPVPASPDAADALAILAPVAAGLALLHDAGLAHGGVRIESLRCTPSGAGVLVGWRPQGSITDDLQGLVSAAHELLPSGSVGSDVAQALVWAADPDPAGVPEERRTMARLASVLDSARRRLASRPDADAPVLPSPPALRRLPAGDPAESSPDAEWGGTDRVPTEATGPEDRGSPVTPCITLRRVRPAGRVGPPRARSQDDPSADLSFESAAGPQASPRRARHAARSGVALPRWRWVLAAAGAVVVAITAVGALRAADAQSAAPEGVCAVTAAVG